VAPAAVSKGPAQWVREEIRALKAYHVAPAEGLVKLDAMENPYRLPPELAQRMGAVLADISVNRYPPAAHAGLTRALRETMQVPDSQSLLLGNGSDEILQIIALALARPGAVALSVEPSFAMYRISAIAAGLRYRGVALRADFTLDEPAFLDAIAEHQPAVVWLSYPNNPTGNLFPRDAVLRIVDKAQGLVVLDEAYYPFSGGATFMSELGAHSNLVLVRTVSKLGLAGLRIGCAIGPGEWLDEFEKLRLPYNVNALSAAAGELLLAQRDTLQEQTRQILAERDAVARELAGIRGVEVFPSAANFVLVRVPDAPRAFEGLRSRGILVRIFHESHPLLAHCLRLTIGTPDENRRLLDALRSLLS
jgi:histidinol-phosphate aminotransferase